MNSLLRLRLPVLSTALFVACSDASPPKTPSGSEDSPIEDDDATDDEAAGTTGTTGDTGTAHDTGSGDTGGGGTDSEDPDEGCEVYGAPDTDCDMLSDEFEENELGTFPDNDDSDGDGLTDYEEVVLLLGHPMCQDSDGDTVFDYDEFLTNTDPWTVNPGLEEGAGAPSCVAGSVVDLLNDNDGDGLPLWVEAAHGISDDNVDSDGDTLADNRELDESDYNTNPARATTAAVQMGAKGRLPVERRR